MEERDERWGLLHHTNYVDDIECGVDPAAPEGYFPEMFRRKTEPLVRFLVVSNDVDYLVDLAGRWHKVEEEPYEPLPMLEPSGWRRWVVVAVLMVGAGVGAAVLVGGWWRQRRRAENRDGEAGRDENRGRSGTGGCPEFCASQRIKEWESVDVCYETGAAG
ncbi:MAG: hypothetical protein N2438_11945 [Limisphaera sp.]|nr:hypothetical protein [Limisphaera sp.]